MSSYIQDLGNAYAVSAATRQPTNSTSRKANANSLDMTDFLTLMVVQLQNQTMDNTADTSDMLNQLVQMQMVTALTNMTDASVMTYASSLVGKEVTVGSVNSQGQMEERVVTITGTGMSNGEQVVFAGDETFRLSSIMAVGKLPQKTEEVPSEGEENKGGESRSVIQPPSGEVDPQKDPEAANNSVGK